MRAKTRATTESSKKSTMQRANGRCISHRVFMNGKLERRNLVEHTQTSRTGRNMHQTPIPADKSSDPERIKYPNAPQETAKTMILATADSCFSTNRDKASIFLRKTESVFTLSGAGFPGSRKEYLYWQKKYSVLIPKQTEVIRKAQANIIATAIPSREENTVSKTAQTPRDPITERNEPAHHAAARSDFERNVFESAISTEQASIRVSK